MRRPCWCCCRRPLPLRLPRRRLQPQRGRGWTVCWATKRHGHLGSVGKTSRISKRWNDFGEQQATYPFTPPNHTYLRTRPDCCCTTVSLTLAQRQGPPQTLQRALVSESPAPPRPARARAGPGPAHGACGGAWPGRKPAQHGGVPCPVRLGMVGLRVEPGGQCAGSGAFLLALLGAAMAGGGTHLVKKGRGGNGE